MSDSAYIRRVIRKDLPYTVEDIGGQKEYEKFKQFAATQRLIKEKESYIKALETKHKAIDAFMAPETVELVQALPQPSKSLIDHFKTIVANIWHNAFRTER